MEQQNNGKTAPTVYQVEHQTIKQYLVEHKAWSLETFGESTHTEGLLKHIEKEVAEAREANFHIGIADGAGEKLLMELVDIVILSVDAMWRLGFSPEQIASALIEKQNINKKRRYPKITDPDQPTEHFREEE